MADNAGKGRRRRNNPHDLLFSNPGPANSPRPTESRLRSGRDSMSSQRSRGNPRSSGRGPGAGDVAEEKQIWNSAQDDIRSATRLCGELEEQLELIVEMEQHFKSKKPSLEEHDQLADLYRQQARLSSEALDILKDGANPLTSKLEILKALVLSNEQPIGEPLRRGGSSRDGYKPIDNIDGVADSPAPSPIVDREKHNLKRVGREARGSLPPKDTPIKQEGGSAEPSVNPSSVEINSKGKITFNTGAEVAFRPKAERGGEQDWIQGVVIKVIGEGKSRRYDVQDPEPDEKTKMPGTVYRTSASSMVSIPPKGQVLQDYPKGRAVLARYPDTTTFYRAEVVEMKGTTVVLRFDGEEDANATMEVDRRFVLDHRG